MAAIDLELGLEHGGRGWGQERTEVVDNFDSEMQEWEDQLQDIQRKIEEDTLSLSVTYTHCLKVDPELYSEVQARRGANDITGHNQKNGNPSECELRQHSNVLLAPGYHSGNHLTGVAITHYCSHDGHGYPAKHQNGYDCCCSNGEIGDLVQDYLEKENKASRKNNRARHVFPVMTAESPLLEKKSFNPGVLGDRKCSSPSVLRKFGAMLQENEGKTLTESGVVTHQGTSPEAKCSTPCCQRRALGASKAPMRVPNQQCQANSDVLTAETDSSQDWGSLLDSARHHYRDQREGCSSAIGPRSVPQQVLGRSQVPGSPKIRPRANSGADREGGWTHGEKAKKPALQQVEPKTHYRTTSPSPGAQRIQKGQDAPGCGYLRDEGLIELLGMLEIQHQYSSSPKTTYTAYRQEPQQVGSPSLCTFSSANNESLSDGDLNNSFQVNPAEMSPARSKTSFSRPARPANQRPPSRWANRTPTARITAPSGPLYRPPSPLTRTPSPALKHRPPISYSLHTETVIM
ncbi:hypothetical protein GOODEAATRI_020309 [Goodea atripinnis]|uniref:SOGA 1/2-like coiled-coil domain-containing protein n=1 Tax=Goodea atripinnis TaxID=208336 RepID=A0ABV0MVQ3_9TELE